MYETHFGLRARPFVETVDPAAFVASWRAARRRSAAGATGSNTAAGPGPGVRSAGIGQDPARPRPGPRDRPAVRPPGFSRPAGARPARLPGRRAGPAGGEGLGSGRRPPPLRQGRASPASTARHVATPCSVVDEAHLIDDPSTFEGSLLPARTSPPTARPTWPSCSSGAPRSCSRCPPPLARPLWTASLPARDPVDRGGDGRLPRRPDSSAAGGPGGPLRARDHPRPSTSPPTACPAGLIAWRTWPS